MTLLLSKTHDITWQDKTVNVEVMLAPLRHQILANKHKALTSKCITTKQIYDKEKENMVKDINIEKRMMERRKNEIQRRKSEILLKRLASAQNKGATIDLRAHSIPDVFSIHPAKRGKSAPPKLEAPSSNTSDVFMTEVVTVSNRKENPAYSEPIRRNSISESQVPPSSTHLSTRSSLKSTTVPYFSVSSDSERTSAKFPRSASQRLKSVRFDTPSENDRNTESDVLFEKINYARLEEKVKQFVVEQDSFNKQPTLALNFRVKQRYRYKSFSEVPDFLKQNTEPMIAKKYSKLTVNKSDLEKAFDRFCENKTPDNLHSMMRLATKQKASVRLARDQSFIPALAAKKSAKIFMNSIRKATKDHEKELADDE